LDYAKLVKLSVTFDGTFQHAMQLQPTSGHSEGQSGRTTFVFSIVTSFAQGILVDCFLKLPIHWSETCERFRRLSAIPHFDSPLGWIWESDCHSKMPKMAQFDATDFDTGEIVTFEKLPENVIRVKEARLVSRRTPAGYYMPAVRDPAKFDAFSITKGGDVVVFQYSSFSDPDFYDRHPVFDTDFVMRKLDSIVVALGKNNSLLPWKAGGRTLRHVLVVPETEVKREEVAMAMQVHDSGVRKWTSHVKKYLFTLRMER
jgi:hypothetical protein